MAGVGGRESVLAERLDLLFETVHPAGRGPYTLREAADAINAEAGETIISAAYLSQLRNGKREEPSHSRLAAIARFFGVDVEYFSGSAPAADAAWPPCRIPGSGPSRCARAGCPSPASPPCSPSSRTPAAWRTCPTPTSGRSASLGSHLGGRTPRAAAAGAVRSPPPGCRRPPQREHPRVPPTQVRRPLLSLL